MEEKQLVECILWEEDVRQPMKYPKEDNNNGYIYGLNLLGSPLWVDDDDHEMVYEILDVQWFKEEYERQIFIDENNLEVINTTN